METSLFMDDVATFLATSVVVIVTPGQDTALVTRSTLEGGLRVGLMTVLGIMSGQAVWATAASAGLSAAVTAWPAALSSLRVAGAVYLAFLGAQSVARAWHVLPHSRENATDRASPITRRTAYRRGLISNLANPKMVFFFGTVVPQLLTATSPWQSAVLGGVAFCSMTGIWLTLYVHVFARLQRQLAGKRTRSIIELLTGIALLGFSIEIAHGEG